MNRSYKHEAQASEFFPFKPTGLRFVLLLVIIFLSGAVAMPSLCRADETFVTIQKVVGNRITFVKAGEERGRGGAMRGAAADPNQAGQGGAGRGRGPRGGAGQGRGRRGGGGQAGRAQGGAGRGPMGGRGRGAGSTTQPTTQPTTVVVPADAKITSAMRERRTFEFRVGVELAGGIRHAVFTRMKEPLSARIVTQGSRITELNVITADTDINQLNTDAAGQTVIAVKPKRPPSK